MGHTEQKRLFGCTCFQVLTPEMSGSSALIIPHFLAVVVMASNG